MSLTSNKYSIDDLEKLGQTFIFLSNSKKVSFFNKTKALKLLYLLDEISIKKFGVPFVGLEYEVWQYGPVAQDVYIDLSEKPVLLAKYIKTEKKFIPTLNNEVTIITSNLNFSDDEFTDNDLETLNYVVKVFGGLSATELTKITHRKSSLWYKIANEKGLLIPFEKSTRLSSNWMIDFTELLDENKKKIYRSYKENKMLEKNF